jgi:hypothetical protein
VLLAHPEAALARRAQPWRVRAAEHHARVAACVEAGGGVHHPALDAP